MRPIGWAVLVILLVACLYLFWLKPMWLAGFVLLLLILAVESSVRSARTRRRLAQLAAARPGESIGTFARAFDPRTTDTWVVRAVYEQLQDMLKGCYPSFPLRPTDRLKEDLELDPDDLDLDLADEISERTGRPVADCSGNPYLGKIATVADIVRFFCAQPRSDGKQVPQADKGGAAPGR